MRTLGGRIPQLGLGNPRPGHSNSGVGLSISSIGLSIAWIALVAAGCDVAGGADASKDVVVAPAVPVIDLVVDANRDGVAKADDPTDQDNETKHDDKFGAIFLPNLDDDNGDRIEDFYDLVEVDAEDAKDLAPITLRGWKKAPAGTNGTLTVEPADKIRVWGKVDGSWALLAGAFDTCDGADNCNPAAEVPVPEAFLRDGIELAIEGREFRKDAKTGWDGIATVKLTVYNKDGLPVVTKDNPEGSDTVSLEIARWLLAGNTSTFDNFWSMKWGTSSNSAPFNKDLDTGSKAQGKATYSTYGNWTDQWTQDFFQTGIVQMPAANGTVQGMRVFNARP